MTDPHHPLAAPRQFRCHRGQHRLRYAGGPPPAASAAAAAPSVSLHSRLPPPIVLGLPSAAPGAGPTYPPKAPGAVISCWVTGSGGGYPLPPAGDGAGLRSTSTSSCRTCLGGSYAGRFWPAVRGARSLSASAPFLGLGLGVSESFSCGMRFSSVSASIMSACWIPRGGGGGGACKQGGGRRPRHSSSRQESATR